MKQGRIYLDDIRLPLGCPLDRSQNAQDSTWNNLFNIIYVREDEGVLIEIVFIPKELDIEEAFLADGHDLPYKKDDNLLATVPLNLPLNEDITVNLKNIKKNTVKSM